MSLFCRLLKVSLCGYKKHLKSLDKPYKYTALLADIRTILSEDKYNSVYGKKRMYDKLQLDYECPYCYNTVANVMRDNGLMHKSNHPKGLTKADRAAQKADNLLNRDFSADAPNKKLVTDITQFIGYDGKVYVSAMFDCFDNACLGISIADNMKTPMVIKTLEMAATLYDIKGAICHSDRGSQYTSAEYKAALAKVGVIQSMNSAGGRCHDNAKCESQWARGKDEISECYEIRKLSCTEIKEIVISYYMSYWNNRRICSAIGGVPPMIKRDAYYEKMADMVA